MSKKVSVADVEKIASLAKLRLTDEEKREAVHYLAHILSYAGALSEVNTESAAPFSPDAVPFGELRSDAEEYCGEREHLVSGSRFTKEQLLSTKAVFNHVDESPGSDN